MGVNPAGLASMCARVTGGNALPLETVAKIRGGQGWYSLIVHPKHGCVREAPGGLCSPQHEIPSSPIVLAHTAFHADPQLCVP